MALIELMYALDKYAGVTRGTSSVCPSFPFGLDDVIVWGSGSVFGATLPLVVERDDK